MEDLMNWASPVPLFGAEDPDRLERMRSFLENYAEAHQLKQTSVSLRFAWKCHEGQFRKSRNRLPYISHPLLMAMHAITLGLVDDDLLAACLLHDVLEDCPVSREELPCSEAAKDAIELLTFEIAEGEDRDTAKARYYERLSHNGIAAMVKMLDRCNNVSYMVDAFSLKKIQQYVVETKIYFYPLPVSIRQEFPEYADAAFALKYHIYSVISTIEIMLDRFNMRERTDVPQPDPNIPEKYY